MRVLTHIKGIFAYLLVLVMFSAPVLASIGSHACCPDPEQSVIAKTSNMSAHYEHLALQDSGSVHLKGAVHDNTSELPCNISCCANVTGTGIVSSSQPALAVDYQFSTAFFPVTDIAMSAADNLHTPPPRIS